MKDRQKPINVFLHVMGWLHDVRFEQGVNDGVFARFVVHVMDFRCENFVFAVLAPGLGKAFQFHIGWSIGGDVHGLALGPNGSISVVGLNGMHFIEVQGQKTVV